MKNSIIKIACATALFGAVAIAQTATTETTSSTSVDSDGNKSSQTTTTTTEGMGTITQYTPGSTIILKEEKGPRTYKFGKTVTYVTKSGQVITEDQVKTRIKVGIPVHVSYASEGDSYVVSRVTVDE